MKAVTKELGAFQHLPMVMCSNDLLPSALKKAKNVGPTKGKSLVYVPFVRYIQSQFEYLVCLNVYARD